ncbi:gamma carbonic anhydrase family protein [Kingella kingae]|uniref:gamma carbonic anhydrase family protein n=1 Tax=Kingella kingae TaxID=504 RepID=UPI00030325D3|nr:gamma carbonic anhydrase family protein [Kingella kingae]MDK4555605.1 gamma carbonic anhydrase family protein [Kingella kingae]MDK4584637.1 gamma carbonic anhydrase family protein [Kingella kingae]MDK4588659.1 gamma carbonic anhydrase family protein [Kingella kingae]MDK4597334.1 gamma carbonic anhydrase family protein [Kingella kingae]MDK4601271.1 gamma carbonic anhydrase family protein [Kingella kingae]
MTIRAYLHHTPQIDSSVYVDDSATIIGQVVLSADSSVWCGAVVRGDVNHIHIGQRSNVQDLAMLHVSHKNDAKPEGSPLIIGDDVTIGHMAMLHGCRIGNRVLVGMGSIILDDAIIEDEVVIGAGSLVPPRKRLASGYLYMGSPVQQIRPLTETERSHFVYSSAHYVKLANQYQKQPALCP